MPATLTPDQLRDLLVTLLAGATDTDEAHWRKLVTVEQVSLIDNLHSNWRIETKAKAADRDAIDRAVEIVRSAHPYVVW